MKDNSCELVFSPVNLFFGKDKSCLNAFLLEEGYVINEIKRKTSNLNIEKINYIYDLETLNDIALSFKTLEYVLYNYYALDNLKITKKIRYPWHQIDYALAKKEKGIFSK